MTINEPVIVDDARQVVAEFENLGDNCEYGFVQRNCGFEEGALFRWSRTKHVDNLIGALECNFEGMFEFDTMRPCDLSMVEDVNFPVQWHTARLTERDAYGNFRCKLSDQEQRSLFDAERQRFLYLRDRFRRRRADGIGILVFKMNTGVSRTEIRRLHRALKSHGPSILFLVHADAPARVGSVEYVEADLAEGWISSFARYNQADQPKMDEWINLCRIALRKRPGVPNDLKRKLQAFKKVLRWPIYPSQSE